MTKAASRAPSLLDAAGLAMADVASQAAGYPNHAAFRRALVEALDAHPGFREAVRTFHGHTATAPDPGKAGQTARKVVQAGRVQAPRHDRPRGAGALRKRP